MTVSSSALRLLGAGALLAGGLLVAGQHADPGAGVGPVVARPVASVVPALPGATASPATTPAAPHQGQAEAVDPGSASRLVVTGLVDVPIVEQVAPVDGIVLPVSYTGAAEVVGLPGQRARVIALHAGPESAPGSALSTRDGQSTVPVGDRVEADGVSYTVASAGVHAKGGEAWAVVGEHVVEADTLVVVTCRPTTASPDHSPYNVVVVAERVRT